MFASRSKNTWDVEVTTCAKPLRCKFWKILDQPAGPCGLQSCSLSLATAASWSNMVLGGRVLNSDGAFRGLARAPLERSRQESAKTWDAESEKLELQDRY